MPVLAVPPYLQFFDANGIPLAGGLVYTYAAGTTTPKATYTDAGGLTQAANPIVLDSSGRTTIWIQGSYKFVVKDSTGITLETTDNVTSFTATASTATAFFQSFSGTGSQTAFTLSTNLGTDENGIMVFINRNLEQDVANGTFATDTIWTKGAGWTIAAGVATATGAISTAISQPSLLSLVQGQAYAVTYTITASAGNLTASIGGGNGIARTTSGTYNEIIVAGASQTIAFTGAGFTGTLDNVTVNVASTAGFDIINPSAYTLNGTSLTFATAPPTGTNNIFVFAPSLAAGAAAVSAAAADASATAAANSQAAAANSQAAAAASAISAAGFSSAKNKWTYSSTTTMADPGTGLLRFNNAAAASTTAIAISDLSANAGNPDVSPWVLSWDDVTGPTVRGTLYLFKDETNFAFFQITGTSADNTGWTQLVVTYLTGNGTISDTNALYIGFAAAGQLTITGAGTLGIQNANTAAITGGTGYFTGTTGTALRSTTSGSLVGVEIIDTGAFGACLKLIGDGATTPSKTIRATGGTLDILNNAVNNVIIRVNDAGDITGSRSITLNSATGVTNAGDVNITGDIRKNGNLVSPTQIITGSTTYNPPSLIDGAGTTTTVTATGAALGDIAVASFSLDLQGITVTAYISSANTVSVRFQNETTGTLDLASGTLKVMVTKI